MLEIQNIICLFVFKIILVKREAGVYDGTTITPPKSFKHFNIMTAIQLTDVSVFRTFTIKYANKQCLMLLWVLRALRTKGKQK